MRSGVGIASLGLVVCTVVACSDARGTDEPDTYAAAERIRGLRFKSRPEERHVTRAQLVAESKSKGPTDAEVAFYQAVWGRLGYFPENYDPHAAIEPVASQTAAFYSSDTKSVTFVDDYGNDPFVVAHELVHALQDQHFGLATVHAARTLDEALARTALIEGDATVCSGRFSLERATAGNWSSKLVTDPQPYADAAESYLAESTGPSKLPAFFAARPAFVYPWGAAFVLKLLEGREWRTGVVDARFRAPPASTEEIVKTALGEEVDPLVDVVYPGPPRGLLRPLEVRFHDRLGLWHTYILLRSRGLAPPDAFALAKRWDGDALEVLAETTAPRSDDAPPPVSSIVWVTEWDDAPSARAVAALLQRSEPYLGGDPCPEGQPSRGPSVCILTRGTRVAIATGAVQQRDARALALASFDPATVALDQPAKRIPLPSFLTR